MTWIGAFHTVTFGPDADLRAVEQHFVVPVAQKAGPPLLTINPKAALPAGGTAYDGTGWVNSGFLQPGGMAAGHVHAHLHQARHLRLRLPGPPRHGRHDHRPGGGDVGLAGGTATGCGLPPRCRHTEEVS